MPFSTVEVGVLRRLHATTETTFCSFGATFLLWKYLECHFVVVEYLLGMSNCNMKKFNLHTLLILSEHATTETTYFSGTRRCVPLSSHFQYHI